MILFDRADVRGGVGGVRGLRLFLLELAQQLRRGIRCDASLLVVLLGCCVRSPHWSHLMSYAI